MAPRMIAKARWTALDRKGHDTCHLFKSDHGWSLMGQAKFEKDAGRTDLTYTVRVDQEWHTTSVSVVGHVNRKEIVMTLYRTGSDWQMNGPDWRMNEASQPQVTGAQDIDLSFTPATNLMPIRRLAHAQTSTLKTKAAWLRFPPGDLRPLDQIYTRQPGSGTVNYAAKQPGYTTTLHVQDDEFVTLYPDLWQGKVTHP